MLKMFQKIIKGALRIFCGNNRELLERVKEKHGQEAKYFLKARKRYINNNCMRNNPSLLLRKRTHHLERYLFAPDSYPSDLAEKISGEIEELLNRGSDISDAQKKWAQKILDEYKTGKECGSSALCPMLINNAERRNAPVGVDDLMELMRCRRSRRVFVDIPLTQSEKVAICRAAQYAPSSCNRQSLYLIFVEDLELKRFVASTVPGGHQFFAKAPCILLIVSDAGDYRYPEDRTGPFSDGAVAAQNIYLLCETMGLGCCMGSYSSFGNIIHEEEVRNKLRIPETHLIVAAMAIGKSKQSVCEIPRDRPEDRFWNNFYGNSLLQS